jgi:hypothetical protein
MFNSKSWADDLVLVSTSKSGLQNCINKEWKWDNMSIWF